MAWVALRRVLAHPRSRPIARGLLGSWALAALVLQFTPSLAAVQPDGWALPVCFAALMFPVGCAIADLLSAEPMAETAGTDRTMHDFVAAMGAAAFVVLFYGSQGVGAGQFSAAGLAASAITHGLAAAAIFLILTIVRSLAAFRERPVYAEFWLTACLLAAGITGVIVAVILPTLSVSGGGRYAAGVGFAVALTLVVVARGRLTALPHGDGVLTALTGFVPARLASASIWVWLAWLPVVAATAWGFAAASRIVDWNFLIATLGVMIVWLLSVSSALSLASLFATATSSPPHPRGAFAGCAIALGMYLAVVPPPSDAGTPTPVDAWTLVDPSFRTLREALRPPTPADTDFYPFLQRNTNLGPDVPVTAFDIRHAPLDGDPAPVRPHVFLFVIDSLRRDYVSAYNTTVTFTPSLGKFAAESTGVRAHVHPLRRHRSVSAVDLGRRDGAAQTVSGAVRARSTRSTTCCGTSSTRRGCRGTTWWTRWCRAQARGRRSAPTARSRTSASARWWATSGRGWDRSRPADRRCSPGAWHRTFTSRPSPAKAAGRWTRSRTPASTRRMRRG